MFATPLGYNDDPTSTLEGLQQLSVYQAKYFATGYIHACNHVNEILTDARSKFFAIALATEDEHRIRNITGITRTLDLLEEALENRSNILEQFLKEHPTNEQDQESAT